MSVNKYLDETTGAEVQVNGSDKRSNTSARTDSRFYYNSRDMSQAYSMVFDDASCTALDYNFTLFNTRQDGFDLVIHAVGINATNDASFQLHDITGSTAAGGCVPATPYRLNRAGKSNVATVTACTVVNSDSAPITGITSIGTIDFAGVSANGHEELRVEDTLRLGQNQGIALQMTTGAAGTRAYGVIFFYFEKTRNN